MDATRAFVRNSAQKSYEGECLELDKVPDLTKYIYHDSFASPKAEQTLFGEAGVGADKQALFLRYNYARYMLSKLTSAGGTNKTSPQVRKMREWHKKALEARSDLVRENLGLVLAMAKRARVPNMEFGDLVSQGNMALLRSVENFDFSKGFRFSTYACRAILRSFNRLASEAGNHRHRFCTRAYIDLDEKAHRSQEFEEKWEEAVDDIRDILEGNIAELSDVEKTIILERFGLQSRGKGKTYAEIGQILGLTYERIRQIHKTALGKIRCTLEQTRFNSPKDFTRRAG
jgi:RNA polymerase primary sigma factor